jgi:hypothetical protein
VAFSLCFGGDYVTGKNGGNPNFLKAIRVENHAEELLCAAYSVGFHFTLRAWFFETIG